MTLIVMAAILIVLVAMIIAMMEKILIRKMENSAFLR